MEQRDQQELTKNLFSEYIADPSVIVSADAPVLEEAINRYPYCQLLHSFHSRSVSRNGADEGEHFRAALISPDRAILKKIITEPESFKSADTLPDTYEAVTGDQDGEVAEEISEEVTPEVVPDQKESVAEESPSDLYASSEEQTLEKSESSESDEVEEPVEEMIEELVSDHQLITEAEPAPEEEDPGNEFDDPWNESRLDDQEDQAADETQEIIDPDPIGAEDEVSGKLNEEIASDAPTGEVETLDFNEDDTRLKEESIHHDIQQPDELDILIREGAAEHYSLEGMSEDLLTSETEIQKDQVKDPHAEEKVTRYDDDKMPYSFLWWLDKTRKEHTENYQPYASNFRLDTSKSISRNAVDPLSSQIIENIFHLQSPVDQFENAPRTVPFQVKRKGDYILEKFIKEEPQIKPPDSQKLDTENKARKSSEDPNDLVSETLAQIYTDQMLYHKAIDTYKKLSLKFPEKSTYFADQIVELEKKIN